MGLAEAFVVGAVSLLAAGSLGCASQRYRDVEAGYSVVIPKDWAFQVISQVGAYSEVFERHLGVETPFGIDLKETTNALVRDGGQMYAYPIR